MFVPVLYFIGIFILFLDFIKKISFFVFYLFVCFQKCLDMVMYDLYLNKWKGEVFGEFKATQVYKSSSSIARNLSIKKNIKKIEEECCMF